MAAVKQVGSEKRKLSEGTVQQIKNEVSATKQMASTRKAGSQSVRQVVKDSK